MALGQDASTGIKANGWRQGSVLPPQLVEVLRNGNSLPHSVGADDMWIVVSHDCDVTNSSLDAEPYVEIVPARVVNGSYKDGNKHWGKNPRKYQFSTRCNDQDVHYELCIHELTRVPRNSLSQFSPETTKHVNAECLKSIVRWISKRYVRASFPDAFNDRTRQATNELRKQFKRNGHLLTGIYILVQDDELDDGDDYQVTVWATMSDDRYENPQERQEAQKLADQLEAQFSACEGIEVVTVELRAEREVSLSDLYLLKRWDFDDLSLREPSRSEIPPVT